MGGNALNRSVRDGLTCQKIESWDKSNWDLLAKNAYYLDDDGEIDGFYDLIVLDFDRYVLELDIVSGPATFDRLNKAVDEDEDLLYVSSHVNTWDISQKFRYVDNVEGSVFYSLEDIDKISLPESQRMLDSVFGYNPVEELEKIEKRQCSNL